jgi:multisubunit Na+/H+ antiporter MnhB subunit
MDPLEASQQLEAIRTLMERAALYRRALAPTTLLAGALGTAAAAVGWCANLQTPRGFGIFWIVVGAVAVTGAMLLMRRQALREVEPFWSPPARRVVRAVAPLFVVGLVVGLLAVWPEGRNPLSLWWLPPIWMVLYGAALHAAGFFLARGITWFGWGFVLMGCALLALLTLCEVSGLPELRYAHGLMGATFGGLHLAYGVYLHLTEPRTNAA